MLESLPVWQLMAWKWRMLYAHRPPCEEAGNLLPPAVRLREPIPDWLGSLSTRLEPLLQPFDMPTPPLPAPMVMGSSGPELWILHMFSGRRRLCDAHQWCIHWAQTLMPEISVRVFSLDTAVHHRLGDLGVGDNYRMVLQLAQLGAFGGTLAGPPCETWSAARHVVCESPGGVRLPRPLRSSMSPWGFYIVDSVNYDKLQLAHVSCSMFGTWNVR